MQLQTRSERTPIIEVLTTDELKGRIFAATDRVHTVNMRTADIPVAGSLNTFDISRFTRWNQEQVEAVLDKGLDPEKCFAPQFDNAILTPDGFKSLAEHLGIKPDVFTSPLVSDGTKLALLSEVLSGADKEIKMRGHYLEEEGRKSLVVDAVLGSQYASVTNQQLVVTLDDVYGSEGIPPKNDIYVASWQITPKSGTFHACFISPDNWYFDLDTGDTYVGTVIVHNNDMGNGAFQVTTGVYRLWCLNYHVSSQIHKETHNYASLNDFKDGLRQSFRSVTGSMDNVRRRLVEMKDINIKWPVDMLEKMLDEAGLGSKKALAMGKQYLEENGDDSMFDVYQAVTHAAKQPTQTKSRKAQPRWDRRLAAESSVWDGVETMIQYASDGGDVEDLYAGEESKFREAVSQYVGNRAEQYTSDEVKEFGRAVSREVIELDI